MSGTSRVSGAVFAHNEEATIARCLTSLPDSVDGDAVAITVIANGCTDATVQTVEQIAAYGDGVRSRLNTWWNGYTQKDGTAIVDTYFGKKPLHEVLERSTWHSGQHVRQIVMAMTEFMGVTPEKPLTAQDFAGLPLPEKVWD